MTIKCSVHAYTNTTHVVNGFKKDFCSINMKIQKIFPDLWFEIQNSCKSVAYVTCVIVVSPNKIQFTFISRPYIHLYARFLKKIYTFVYIENRSTRYFVLSAFDHFWTFSKDAFNKSIVRIVN